MKQNCATIISGKDIAQKLLLDIAAQIKDLEDAEQRKPCLAVILVGEDPASQIYVRNKKQACARVGIKSLAYTLVHNSSQDEILQLINQLNQNPQVDGILIQLPLPEHIDSKIVINHIAPHKDVDGFHRYNMGSLAINDTTIAPCTPRGIMYLLDEIKLSYPGKHAVILGTSNIVGRPMALELINRGTTVTICNSKTRNLAGLIKQADLLITAIGKPKFVPGLWLKPGSIAIDVGINQLPNGKLCGDIDYATALNVVSYITPVPGGVGPMTIAILLQNTILCYTINSKKNPI